MSKEKTNHANKSGVAMQIALSLISILLGGLLLFVPEIQVKTLCYIFCGTLIAAGIAAIISFFLTESYKRVENYDFALGVLLLLLGCCGFLRSDELAADFSVYMGITALCLGVLILQGTVQMHILGNRLWVVNLFLTIASLAGAVLVLADVKAVTGRLSGFTYWVLLIVGAACLVSLLLTTVGVKYSRHKADKRAGSEAAEAADAVEKPEA